MPEALDPYLLTQASERLPGRSSRPTSVEVNTYDTRNVYKLVINGRLAEWHSVKGGLGSDKKGNIKIGSYEILYCPETDQWLKTIAHGEIANPSTIAKMEDRLRTSAEIQRTALQIADFPDLAEQVQDIEHVELHGHNVYGFISPHIGPSLEYIIKATKKVGLVFKKVPEEIKELAEGAYRRGFEQAVELYFKYGYWMDDPNPGNILLRKGRGGWNVVLIDFSNKIQMKDSQYSKIPFFASFGGNKEEKIKKYQQRDLDVLFGNFSKAANNIGIKLDPDMKLSLIDVDESS